MDEISLSFDFSYNTTLEKSDSKTVSLHTIGYEKRNFIVILSCMADSTKLLAVIFFKLKTWLKKEKFLSRIYMHNKKKDIAIIPSSLTSKLQLLDVSINQSFKATIANEVYELTKTSNISLETDSSEDDLLFDYEGVEDILKADQYDEFETIKINNNEYPKEEYINYFAENIKTSSNKDRSDYLYRSDDLYRSDNLYESDNLSEYNNLYESDNLE
ncbi:1422_t:CDS:2 [Scutellospora calospora]|uniref:1422_t:CDS:1 n=1 Tax=Scutellospora calospora TaxID=85575 RepID=A0ACA9L292_9GLOM|nr:1422_t:CDS:2 [Scutellospora calospora]